MNTRVIALTALIACLLVLMLPVESPGVLVSSWTGDIGRPADGSGSERPQASGKIIVKVKAGISLPCTENRHPPHTGMAAWDRLHQEYQVATQRPLLDKGRAATLSGPLGRIYVLQIDDDADPEAAARDYASLPEVEYAHPDYKIELYDAPDDPLYPHQWALNNTGQGCYHVERIEGDYNDTLAIVQGTPDADIDAAEVFDSPPDATVTVVVAIVDTGVDWDHPDLAGMIWNNPREVPDNEIDDDHNGYVDDVVGWDFCALENPLDDEDNDPTDTHGHGTHCAGIVAATINNATGVTGVVSTARIMGIKCFPTLTIEMLLKGVVYAADNGADVVNMSWGTWAPLEAMEEVMQYARSRGVILVASAGNDGAERWNYPASLPQTICVSATDNDDHVTDWSTYSELVDVSAPGQSILSLRSAGTDMYSTYSEPEVHIINDWYYLASGTSMSAPYVVAVATYLRAVSPGITHDVAKQVIESSADDVVDPYGQGDHYPGWDMYSGHGRINLSGALAAAPRVRAIIESPYREEVVSGAVDILGSADGDDFTGYTLEYGAGLEPSEWTEITTSAMPVTEGLLGTWEANGLEGLYAIHLQVGDNVASVYVFATDSFIVEIADPAPYDTVAGVARVSGSAVCHDFSHTVLEAGIGTTPGEWVPFDTLTKMICDGFLANWFMTGLPPEQHNSLRLSVYSNTGLAGSDTVVVFYHSMFSGDHGWSVALDSASSSDVNYGDFDSDGANEIVVGTEVGVQFFNTDGTQKIVGAPIFPSDRYRLSIAVGSLDGDPIDDIVALGMNDGGTIYGHTSAAGHFQVALEARPDGGDRVNKGAIYLKDINGDGIDEIHYFPGYVSYYPKPAYYYIYRSDGTAWGGNFPPPPVYTRCFPADLDGNGIDEIYCYNDETHHLVQFDTLGIAVDSILIESDGFGLGPVFYEFSAVDIDNDSCHELILKGQFLDSPILSWLHIWAIDSGLSVMDGWPHTVWHYSWISPGYSRVAFGDINDDGVLEYMLCTHCLHVWNLDGSRFLPGTDNVALFADPPYDGSMWEPVIADLNGDGLADILGGAQGGWVPYPCECVVAFDQEGETMSGFPELVDANPEDRVTVGVPTVGDINQDGYIDFVYPWQSKLVFTNLAGNTYNANNAYRPMRGYNRRLNHTARLAGEIVVVCGDINADGLGPNIADLTFLVAYLFNGGNPPPREDMADINGGDGRINIVDLAYLVDYLFGGGPAPDCP